MRAAPTPKRSAYCGRIGRTMPKPMRSMATVVQITPKPRGSPGRSAAPRPLPRRPAIRRDGPACPPPCPPRSSPSATSSSRRASARAQSFAARASSRWRAMASADSGTSAPPASSTRPSAPEISRNGRAQRRRRVEVARWPGRCWSSAAGRTAGRRPAACRGRRPWRPGTARAPRGRRGSVGQVGLGERRASASKLLEGGAGVVGRGLGDLDRRAVVGPQHEQAVGARVVESTRSSRLVKLPSHFDIFSPPTSTKPLCTQWRAKVRPAATAWARSFSWWGKARSSPPPWMSKPSPRRSSDITTHSVCQPGRPSPHGEGHAGSPGLAIFHRAKSIGVRLSLGDLDRGAAACSDSSDWRASRP